MFRGPPCPLHGRRNGWRGHHDNIATYYTSSSEDDFEDLGFRRCSFLPGIRHRRAPSILGPRVMELDSSSGDEGLQDVVGRMNLSGAERGARGLERNHYESAPPGFRMRPRREGLRRDPQRERGGSDFGDYERRGLGREPGSRPGMRNGRLNRNDSGGTPSEGGDPFGEGSFSGDTLVGDPFGEDPFGGHNQRPRQGGRPRERHAFARAENDRPGGFGRNARYGAEPGQPGGRPSGANNNGRPIHAYGIPPPPPPDARAPARGRPLGANVNGRPITAADIPPPPPGFGPPPVFVPVEVPPHFMYGPPVFGPPMYGPPPF